MKIIIWMVVPSIIVYVFWITYKIFKRRKPEEGSIEDEEVQREHYI